MFSRPVAVGPSADAMDRLCVIGVRAAVQLWTFDLAEGRRSN